MQKSSIHRVSDAQRGLTRTDKSVAEELIASSNYPLGYVLLRETLQNSCDSRVESATSIDFRVSLGKFSQLGFSGLKSHVFQSLDSRITPELAAYINGEKYSYLAIRDNNTSGLDGPTDLGTPQANWGNFLRFFFYYGSNKNKDAVAAGGSAGVGRTVLTNASSCSTILVFTRIGPGVQDLRFMAFTNGKEFSQDGTDYTGRHFWGVQLPGGLVAPLEGQQVFDLAETLGLANELPDITGTLIVILEPGYKAPAGEGQDSSVQLFNQMQKAALLFAWPHIIDKTVNFNFEIYEEKIGLPELEDFIGLKEFVSAYCRLKESQNVQQIQLDRPRKNLGELASVTTTMLPTDPDFLELVPGSAIALMRQARFVVKYLPVPSAADGGLIRGVFLTHPGQADSIFRKSEGGAHDDWLPSKLQLPPNHANPVKVALEKIQAAFKKAPVSRTSETGGKAGLLSKIFGQELASQLGGWGPSATPSTNGKSGSGGAGAKGQAAIVRLSAPVQILEATSESTLSQFTFAIAASKGAGALKISFGTRLINADGGSEDGGLLAPIIGCLVGKNQIKSAEIEIEETVVPTEVAVFVQARVGVLFECLVKTVVEKAEKNG